MILTVSNRLVDLLTRAQTKDDHDVVGGRDHVLRLVTKQEAIVGTVTITVSVYLDGGTVYTFSTLDLPA